MMGIGWYELMFIGIVGLLVLVGLGIALAVVLTTASARGREHR
jgi:hypothetical protein